MAHSHHNTEKRTFKHLTPYDRGQIYALHNQGKTMQEIADAIDRNKSTVSRELKRGSVLQRRSDLSEQVVYFPDTGQAVYEKNRARCGTKYKLASVSAFIGFALEKIQQHHWSPDAVCGYAKAQGLFPHSRVCTKTLYHYIELGLLPIKNIDLPMKVSRKPKSTHIRQHKKVLGRSIEQRPVHIQTRKEHMLKIYHKQASCVQQAIQKLKQLYGTAFSSIFKTITSDNGSEFSMLCDAIVGEKLDVYYTHPYTSCERGTNERHNGLIRRFIPKGKSIDEINDQLITYIENWINTLPRKILGYRSPNDAYFNEIETII